MNIKNFLMLGGVALGLGLTSCVGDLDLDPIDPNLESPESPTLLVNQAMECYQTMATSGQEGPGSSIISGLDNGRGQYTRALFMMNVFPTDECIWIWKDDGIYDLVTNTFDSSNGNIYGTYSRLFAHIALCNQFIAEAEGNGDAEIKRLRDEVRALRAMSYYWMCDIFGKSSFTVSRPDGSSEPVQYTRVQLYEWLENELRDIVDNGHLADVPVYGRVGKDGAEALLARLYLNAEVYCGTPAYDKCAVRCENIIARHTGGGFKQSGLAENYLYLFCRNNEEYMPGGGNVAENEILWGIPFDSERLQSYGGTMLLINGALANSGGISELAYGCSNAWQCMKAPQQFSECFTQSDQRWSLWVKGKQTWVDEKGVQQEKDYKITNDEFTQWGDGYICIKWTGLTHGANNPGGAPNWDSNIIATQFPDTDLGLIRLADVYLMYSECAVRNAQGTDKAKALNYANYIRERAGVSLWSANDLTLDNLLAERCRELYWELTRRTDLIRFGRFTGPNQMLWAWKGNALEGNNIDDRYNLMPIPVNIIAASPSFKQNKGYGGNEE